jgi:hypothetical protein
MTTSRWVLIGMMATLTAACGSPVVQPLALRPAATAQQAAATRPADLFPTTAGHVWQYVTHAQYQDDPDHDYPGTESATIESVRRSGRSVTLQLRVIDDFSNKLRFPTLTMDDQGVRIAGTTYWGSGAREAEGYAFQLVGFPLTPGHKWDDGEWAGTIKGQETVKVQAGTFQAWNVEAFGTFDHEYTAVGNYWIAPGVGIVKSALSIPGGLSLQTELLPPGAKAPKGRAKRPITTRR